MAYESKPMGNRLGIYAPKVEQRRRELGIDERGFRLDGTDAAGADKEAALAELYRRADSHLPAGIGGPISASVSEAEGAQEDGGTEDEEAP